MKILIVRLGALGDIVHAVPAAAALRAAFPAARIDWLVDARHRAFLDLVAGLDRIVTVAGRSVRGWIDAVHALREVRYDVAFDLQGLMKSAVLARASGAARVIGFSLWHLREKAAWPLYSDTGDRGTAPDPLDSARHVIFKNLRLLRVLGVESTAVAFPLVPIDSPALREVQSDDERPFALINPGAAWPNKRWPAARFGEVASFLRDVRGIRSIVLWGPGEQALARAVVEASAGAATEAPPTAVADLVALAGAASVMISGDTGPLHLGAVAGTPLVAIFGPTDPLRNGPWRAEDVAVTRYAACACHYERRCKRKGAAGGDPEARWCLEDVGVREVTAALQQRLGPSSGSRRSGV